MASAIQAVLDGRDDRLEPDRQILGRRRCVIAKEATTTTTEITWNRSRHSDQEHPHVLALTLDPIAWHRFRSFFEPADQGVTILDARLDGPDRIVVQAGCTCEEVLDQLHTAWA